MVTVAYNQRQHLSMLLVLSMLFSIWVVPTQAGLLGSVGSVAKTIFVNAGAVATGVLGAAVGAALGGGPLGMAAGGIGGFIVGKKVLNWTTSSMANFATVAGAIAGGALCIGMGFPMLAVGVIGGGLIARLAVNAASKLFGKKTPMITESQVNPDAAAAESAAAAAWLDQLNKKNDTTVAAPAKVETPKKADPVQSSPQVKDSQTAYDKYTAAYKNYMAATQKGDAKLAQAAYAEYKQYLGLYNSYIKSGK
ncbi:MAG: hypothetical protein AB1403_12190 [Candidatus Riflebacteria bacterium]